MVVGLAAVARMKTRRGLEPVQKPGDEVLESTTNSAFAGEKHSQPGGQQRAKKSRGRHWQGISWESENVGTRELGPELKPSQFRQASSAISTATRLSWAKS